MCSKPSTSAETAGEVVDIALLTANSKVPHISLSTTHAVCNQEQEGKQGIRNKDRFIIDSRVEILTEEVLLHQVFGAEN